MLDIFFQPFVALWRMRYNWVFGDRRDNKKLSEELSDLYGSL